MLEKLQDLNNPRSLRSHIRRKRVHYLVEFVRQVVAHEQQELIEIADIGGNFRYWDIFPFEQFKITLINLSERRIFEPATFANVTFAKVIGDACSLAEIKDGSFDISHSNSVIKHVGDWQHVKLMRDEILRIGKHYFVQTPNYWFPIEPHFVLPFVHWLPRPWYVAWLMCFKKNSFDQATLNFDSHRMLSKRELMFLFPSASIITKRFALLQKSFIAVSALSSP